MSVEASRGGDRVIHLHVESQRVNESLVREGMRPYFENGVEGRKDVDPLKLVKVAAASAREACKDYFYQAGLDSATRLHLDVGQARNRRSLRLMPSRSPVEPDSVVGYRVGAEGGYSLDEHPEVRAVIRPPYFDRFQQIFDALEKHGLTLPAREERNYLTVETGFCFAYTDIAIMQLVGDLWQNKDYRKALAQTLTVGIETYLPGGVNERALLSSTEVNSYRYEFLSNRMAARSAYEHVAGQLLATGLIESSQVPDAFRAMIEDRIEALKVAHERGLRVSYVDMAMAMPLSDSETETLMQGLSLHVRTAR